MPRSSITVGSGGGIGTPGGREMRPGPPDGRSPGGRRVLALGWPRELGHDQSLPSVWKPATKRSNAGRLAGKVAGSEKLTKS